MSPNVRRYVVGVLSLVVSVQALAQTRSPALLSRPPALLDSSDAFRMRTIMGIHVARIRQSLAVSDSSSLQRELSHAQVPASELTAVRSRGCQTLGWMLEQYRTGQQIAIGTSLTALNTTTGNSSSFGTDSASVGLSLSGGQTSAVFRLDFQRQGDELVLVRAVGLHTALCSVAAHR